MSEDKQVYRKSLDARHADANRTFSFKFRITDERQQQARKILEQWELQYYEEAGEEVPMNEIITDLVLDMEYGKPSPRMDDRRLINMLLKRIESMESILQELATRNPVTYQEVGKSYREQSGGEIDDDFINSMFDDFDSMGDR